jgi:hypothetical protein
MVAPTSRAEPNGMENQPDFRIKAADEDHLHFNELRAAAAQYAG